MNPSIHLTTGTFNLLSKTDSLSRTGRSVSVMDDDRSPHPSSNLVLRRLNANLRSAHCTRSLMYAAEKTAQ
jgi:hypothetical protein